MSGTPTAEAPRQSALVKHTMFLLRIAVPIAALAYILSKIPLAAVMSSARRVTPVAVLVAVVINLISMLLATARWRVLFTACGTGAKPRFWDLFRVYWVCIFYNSWLPGGVGGEVVRGLATRRAVGERGLANALGIVLLERTLGFSGMLIVVVAAFTFIPLPGLPDVMMWSAIGICAALGSVIGIVSGHRLAPYLPQPLRRIAAVLPTITSLPLFALALLMSIVTQLCGVVAGHAIVASITKVPTFADSLLILPLINALQYFPFSVGGTGVRETGFMVLYPLVGVSTADAVAASFVVGLLQYAVSGVGGILHALRRLDHIEG